MTGVVQEVDALIDRQRSPLTSDDATAPTDSHTNASANDNASSSSTQQQQHVQVRRSSSEDELTLLANLKHRHDEELHRIATLTGKARHAALVDLLLQTCAAVPRSAFRNDVAKRYYELIAMEYAH